MDLRRLTQNTGCRLLRGDALTEITSVCCDSRCAGSGALFVCLPGRHADGHEGVGHEVVKGVPVQSDFGHFQVPSFFDSLFLHYSHVGGVCQVVNRTAFARRRPVFSLRRSPLTGGGRVRACVYIKFGNTLQ